MRLVAEGEEQAHRLASQEQTIAALRDELTQTRSAAQVLEVRIGDLAQRLDDPKDEIANACAAQSDGTQLVVINWQLEEQSLIIARLSGTS